MLRRVIALFFLLIFSAHLFNQGIYYLSYHIDHAAYIKRCENKWRPQMHCDGKCYLMKRIAAQQKKEEQQYPGSKLVGKAEIVSSKNFPPSIHHLHAIQDRHLYACFNADIITGFPSTVFHPPGVLVS